MQKQLILVIFLSINSYLHTMNINEDTSSRISIPSKTNTLRPDQQVAKICKLNKKPMIQMVLQEYFTYLQNQEKKAPKSTSAAQTEKGESSFLLEKENDWKSIQKMISDKKETDLLKIISKAGDWYVEKEYTKTRHLLAAQATFWFLFVLINIGSILIRFHHNV